MIKSFTKVSYWAGNVNNQSFFFPAGNRRTDYTETRSLHALMGPKDDICWIFMKAGQLCLFIYLIVYFKKAPKNHNVNSLVFKEFSEFFMKNKTTIISLD